MPVFASIGSSIGSNSNEQMEQMISNNQFLQAVGMSAEFLSQPIGLYGFITGWFFSLACAVLAMHVGLAINTKDFTGRSADFLYTKPFSREKIYLSKLGAATVAVFTVGIVYFFASFISLKMNIPEGFDFKLFFLLAFSLILLESIYLALGFFIGIIWPKNRKPLLLAVTVVFITVIVGTFAATTGIEWLLFLAPPKFFGGSIIVSTGGYETKFVLWLVFIVLTSLTAGYFVFRKKDLITI
jgi:ABC-2 type transport system permease protein